jgi:hypothetical protein
MKRLRAMFALGIALLSCACSTVPGRFAPSDPLPAALFRHDALDVVLRTHVRDGHVDYPGIAGDEQFKAYLRQLDRIDPEELGARADTLAFWIDAYNALAIKGILAGDAPLTTVGKYRYFISRTFRVGGGDLNLWGLEHKILIPLGEPRVHFAIVCASWSCPKLRSGAYLPESLETQLEQAARDFINDSRRNRFDRDSRKAYLSMVFKWYREEFERAQGSLLRYLARYVDDPELAQLLGTQDFTIEYVPYDWSLNGIAPR